MKPDEKAFILDTIASLNKKAEHLEQTTVAHFRNIRAELAALSTMISVVEATPTITPRPESRTLGCHQIALLAAELSEVPVDFLYQSGRASNLVRPRQFAMYLMLQAGYAQCDVARHFERNHGTVMHAVGCVRNRIDTEHRFKELVDFALHKLHPATQDKAA